MRISPHSILLIFAVLLLAACGAQAIADAGTRIASEEPGRRDYLRQFRESGTITLVYGSQGPDGGAACRKLLEDFQARSSRVRMTIRSDEEMDAAQLGSESVFLVGSPASHRWITAGLQHLPVAVDSLQIRFDGLSYDDPSTVFMASFYPNPWNPQYSMGIATAVNEAAVLALFQQQGEGELRRFFWDRWGYELFRGGQRLIMGQFSDKPENRWSLDKAVHWDLSAGEQAIEGAKGFRYLSHGVPGDSDFLDSLRQRHSALREAIRAFTGKTPVREVLFHLYPSAELKGLTTGNTDHAHVEVGSGEAHLIVNAEYRDNASGREGEVWLRETLRKPLSPALETGIAIRLTPQWQKRGYRHWAEKLYRADALPAPEVFLDPAAFPALSPLVRGCVAALWVEFLIQEEGKDHFLQQYTTLAGDAASLARWGKPWHQFLAATFPYEKPAHTPIQAHLPYLKGFNFGHEGYQIYNGYASSRATESIAALHDIGGNAISIIPYSYIRDPKKPSPFPLANSAGDENDEGLIHSAFEARQRDMITVMKPQIWVGRGSWPGDIEMQSEEEWKAFFRYYEAWMVHYALMAEIHDMDMLCVGTEFAKATLARENDWRRLIRKLRSIYSGPMVYAANWGDEFENLKFWDELDYIGLDCYYPLTKANQPSDADLLAGFQEVMQKVEKIARRNKKPVILTEIGFRSVDAPWKQPHESSRGPALSMECQERCYRVVVQTLGNADFIEGIFWWKWPSTLENGGPGDDGFGPNGKPAEQVVADWFREME